MIEIRELTKEFGRTRAVDGLSFTVKPGAVTGFLGPNGAGKSTTMRAVLGLDRPTSGEALVEMRRLLGVLRSENGAPELAPSPGLAGLPELASLAGLAGVQVDLSVHGDVRLPDGVELSVYRIVQEALTNVVKHAAPAHCRVSVDADEHEARIEITDDGPGVRLLPGPTGGHGLIGMRERVMMYVGVFTAGPRPDGGFAVSARLPYQASERS